MPRYTIDFGRKFDALLTQLAEKNGTTKSEIIRRAVAVYGYLTKEVKDDHRLSITDDAGRVLKDIILP